MATSTDNLNLRKPDTTDNWSVQDDFNANMGKIDDFAGLFMIDFGSKSVSAFHDALSSTMSGVANGQSVSFTVNFTDSVSPMSSGAHTGVATRSSSTRVNVILQRSGSSTNDSYLGSLTSNGWVWDKVATKSQIDELVVYEDYEQTIEAFAAGDPGSRALQYQITVNKPGYTTISAIIKSHPDSARLNCKTFLVGGTSNNIYLNVYRASGAAYTGGTAVVRGLFLKNP